MTVRVSVLTERRPGERRVAATPETVRQMVEAGLQVRVEVGAGAAACFPDDAYAEAGGALLADRAALLDTDVLLGVRAPAPDELELLGDGTLLVSFLPAWAEPEVVRMCADRGVTSYSLDLVPRTTRAQSMDALSSQAMVTGYRGALLAAEHLPRFFPMAMTAAGTVPPARVLVLGTGVAGLQAIATARRLGAVVEANDVRSAAAEEVRSLGATFLDLGLESQDGAGGYARAQSADFVERQRALLSEHLGRTDAVITTAAVPGRPAPTLVTAEMVRSMQAGSVVVDLAADGGGNCALTVPGEMVVHSGVAVVGVTNPPSTMPQHASTLLARNVLALLRHVMANGNDDSDEISTGCCVTRRSQVVHPLAAGAPPDAPLPVPTEAMQVASETAPQTAPQSPTEMERTAS
jgi:NAD(P) transhydrogenase subunit alpha